MNNYKVSFFDGTGYEGALVVTAESADAAEVLAKEAAEFYGYCFALTLPWSCRSSQARRASPPISSIMKKRAASWSLRAASTAWVTRKSR